MIDNLDPRPLWQQLADELRERIRNGDLEPRQVLPSLAHLQQEHGVSRGTVRHALRVLADEGWVVTIQGRGSFVRPQEDGGGG